MALPHVPVFLMHVCVVDGNWALLVKLTAPDGDAQDYLGYSVSFNADGTRVATGAYEDDTDMADRAGSVYVFGEGGVYICVNVILC